MHAFEVLGDPVRRRILELIADGERSSGEVCAAIQRQFGISQPAVSQHLRVLRDAGFASVRPVGTRRMYSVSPAPLRDIDAWLDRFRRWFLPVSGDLRLGGRFQIEGNASGTIERCDPPKGFTATWEYGGAVS